MSESSNPGWYSATSGVSAASAARCPPAEPPVIAMYDGSPPYWAMFSRTHAIVRLTSTICAGNRCLGASR